MINIEKAIIEHCSPTLAGLKTAGLFTIKYTNKDLLHNSINTIGISLSIKGISIKVLREKNNVALIYVYRKNMLQLDMGCTQARDILYDYGYRGLNLDQCVSRLAMRINNLDEFPHEIGLFLGYPPIDVAGFICNMGQNCNLCGYWKVYGDTELALTKFAQYDKCKLIYKKLWQEGRDIMTLTVNKQIAS